MWRLLERSRTLNILPQSIRSLSMLSSNLNTTMDALKAEDSWKVHSPSMASIGGMISEMGNKERYYYEFSLIIQKCYFKSHYSPSRRVRYQEN